MTPDDIRLIRRCAEASRAAARRLAATDAATRSATLDAIALALEAREAAVLAANAKDLEAAGAAGLSAAMQDRLRLDPTRFAALVGAVRAVNALPDPLGGIEWQAPRADGL